MMINGFHYREWVGGNQFSKELTNGILPSEMGVFYKLHLWL